MMRMLVALLIVVVPAALAQKSCQDGGYLPEPERIDCFPAGGATEELCHTRNCVWCPAQGGNYPWCYYPPGMNRPPGYGCEEDWARDEDRIDCFPEPGADEQACRSRNCTWCPTGTDGIPWCYLPQNPTLGGYHMVGEPIPIDNGFQVNLEIAQGKYKLRNIPMFEGKAEKLTLLALFDSDERLRIKIVNPDQNRWEVPLKINAPDTGNDNPLYEVEFVDSPLFAFKVKRKSTGAVLFDTSAGSFIFANQYLTMSWYTPTENVYGIGENEQHTLRHKFDGTTWALWGRDQPPAFTTNMYGVQPYYTCIENDGNAHSVAIVNSNAQEFTFNAGSSIKFTTIGGIFDMYFFLGPEPEQTVQQYTQAVGRPQMPPYWALGFQLCRYGYNTIENMKEVVDRTTFYKIPQDVQYGDIDIMERALTFTYSEENFPGLPDYIRELKTRGIKFMTILDPCFSIAEPPGSYRPFDLGQEMGVWVMKEDGTPAQGKVWPEDDVFFPDYSNNATKEWWHLMITEFHDLLEYDGLWIDMNEPANFVAGDIIDGCATNQLNNPPYVPAIADSYLPAKTLCPDHIEAAGLHYDTHNLFGWFQSEPTLLGTRAGTGKRALVLSRSTFLGSGHWVAHWLGDNWSLWSNLHYSIIGILQFNQFGIPFVGPDICGFIGDTNAQLCQRWMELGAFYPFSRNHNGLGYIDQDPGAFGEEVAVSSRNALLVRYDLLPYLYTLFYKSNTVGNTVARPLWAIAPTDENTHFIDRQFFWGDAVLISPVLDADTTLVSAYFTDDRYYSYYDGEEVDARGTNKLLNVPFDFIPVHIRGGRVVPTQDPDVNTDITRNNPFGLIVAMDDNESATGSLFYDDGDTIETVEKDMYFYATFTAASKSLTSVIEKDNYPEMANKILNKVRLLGVDSVTEVTVNGEPHTDFETLPSGEVVLNNLNLPANQPFVITY